MFVATLVLARLLAPDDFGLVAFALAVLAYLDSVKDAGVGEALIYRHDAKQPRIASTAFWIQIVVSSFLVAATWLAAPLIARATDHQETVWILRILALQFLISAVVDVNFALLRHSLEFKKLFVPDQLSGLAKGSVSVALAFAGAGVWSLVWGQLAGAIARAAGVRLVSAWRPSAAIERREVRPIVKLGVGFSAVAILGEAARNIDYLIVGVRLGAEELGYYSLAFRLPDLAILTAFQLGWRILFPFYSRLHDTRAETVVSGGRDELVEGYLQSVRIAALLAFPAAAGMAVVALPLVLLLFGDKWESSAGPLAFIAIWAALNAIAGMPGTVLKALGRPALMTMSAVGYLLVLAPALWFSAGIGITAVAAAHVVVQSAHLAVMALVAARVLDVPWTRTPANVLPGVVAACAVAAAVYPLVQVLPGSAAIFLAVPVAVGAYAAVLGLVFPADLRWLLTRVRVSPAAARAAPGG